MNNSKNNMFSNISKKKATLSDDEVKKVVNEASLISKSISVETPKKSGRPKSIIKRKQTMFSLSEYQLEKLSRVEGKLKAEGVKIKRGRSETLELALALMDMMLSEETRKKQALVVVEQYHNYEENDPIINK